LSHFGAKVIYPPTIQPVMQKNIPVWIKNTFDPAHIGTIIKNESTPDKSFIRGISSIKDICLLSLEGSGMVGIPGFSKRLFDALAKKQINIILITQSSSEHSICVGVNMQDGHQAKLAVDAEFEQEINTNKVEPLIIEKDVSILALVGEKMKSHPGVSGKMFGVLGRNGINVRAIAQGSSEKNISAVIATQDVRKAINVLHEEFFETSYKQVNVYIAGAGNVGRAIARELLDNGHQVLLIDRDPKALKIDSVPDAEWLMADACEIASLDNAQLNNCQVLVAATGDDKVNLVASLLGKTEYGVPRVVARINHPKNEWLFDQSWGVDVAVSTPRIIAALVEEAVSVGDVVRLFSFRKGQANLVEITLPDSSICIGKTIEEVELPEDASLAAIVRDGRVISPTPSDLFIAGDELLFVASAQAEDKIRDCFIARS
jgi:trk system potassium uptake protein TrkA